VYCFFRNLLTSERPSECTGLLSEVKKALLSSSKFKRGANQEELSPANNYIFGVLKSLARCTYLRHFVIEDIDSLISMVFDADIVKDTAIFNLVCNPTQKGIHKIKYQTIKYFFEQVQQILTQKGVLFRSARNVYAIREYYPKAYNIENLMSIFYWIEPLVDIVKSSKRVQFMMKGNTPPFGLPVNR
jgi:hypothetical protein